MDVFAKCARCGATVEPCDVRVTAGGTRVWFWTAATTCTMDTDGGVALDFDGAAVLCPDCMQQYMDWLAEAPDKRQEPCQSADGDSVEKLAADMAMVIANVRDIGVYQYLACCYFGHYGGVACLDKEASTYNDECPAYGDSGPESCCEAMFDDIRRRCEALGIGLEGGEEDAGR